MNNRDFLSSFQQFHLRHVRGSIKKSLVCSEPRRLRLRRQQKRNIPSATSRVRGRCDQLGSGEPVVVFV